MDLNVRQMSGATILGMKERVKGFTFNPGAHTIISAGTILIVLGNSNSIKEFKRIFVK